LAADQPLEKIVAVESWLQRHADLVARHPEAVVMPVTEAELAAASSLTTPNQALVVARMPAPAALPKEEWCLVLETLQDPGNLGTIIRIADWFGIPHVVCSPDSADAFAPKVVQAGMGGHLRVQLHHTDLNAFLDQYQAPVLAAVLGGEDAHGCNPMPAAALLIGNESRGLSAGLQARASRRITIPRRGGAESLNAAVSAGILCALLTPR
jgi:TrmH family RNA methyltransferase